jgi:hypothetical protein
MVKGGSEKNERPTIRPAFDPEEYARSSEKIIAVKPAPEVVPLPCRRDQLPTVRAFSPADLATTLPRMRDQLPTVPAFSPADLAATLPSKPPMVPARELPATASIAVRAESPREPRSPRLDTAFTTDAGVATDTIHAHPAIRALGTHLRALQVATLAATVLIVIGLIAHGTGSPPSPRSSAVEASSAVQVPSEEPVRVAAPAVARAGVEPASPVAEPRRPTVQAPNALPSKPAPPPAPVRAAPRRKDSAADRDAVLNPFE